MMQYVTRCAILFCISVVFGSLVACAEVPTPVEQAAPLAEQEVLDLSAAKRSAPVSEPEVLEVRKPPAAASSASVGGPEALALPAAERILFTDSFADYAVDGDQDGLFESLVVDVEVAVSEANNYNLGASIYVVDAGGVAHGIDGVQRWLFLEEGVQMVSMTFEGKYIRLSEQNGPYQLSDLWVTHIQNPTPMQLRENVIDSRQAPYVTTEYAYEQFQGP